MVNGPKEREKESEEDRKARRDEVSKKEEWGDWPFGLGLLALQLYHLV